MASRTVKLPFDIVRRAAWKPLHREIVEVDDGNITYEFVFQHDGTLYSAAYLQMVHDGRYWGEFFEDNSPEFVECVVVRPVEKTVVVYEPVEEGA
jgi:hypothetical protein